MTGTKAALGTPCEVEGRQEEKAVADQQQMTLCDDNYSTDGK